jgi:hypothetical protein
MPSDKFLAYKEYLATFATLKSKQDPATFDEWLRFQENETTDSTRNLELATALASGDGSQMLDVRTGGSAVTNQFGHHATAYLTALARSRIPRMTRMIAYCDQIEDKLMDRMGSMNDADALRAYYLLGQTINANTELIKYMLDYTRGTPADPTQQFDIVQFGDKVGDNSFNDMLNDKHDRDKLRNAVRLLITGATPHLLMTGAVEPEKVVAETKTNGKPKKRR